MKRFPRIFLLSIAILYIEILLIRWVATEIRIFAYLQNTILVVCLLGLGTGCTNPKEKARLLDSLIPFSILIGCLTVPFVKDGFVGLSALLASFHDFLIWSIDPLQGTQMYLGATTGIVGAFLVAYLIWQTIHPLGVMLGKEFEQAASTPLRTYSYNIAGSLFGVWLFALLAALAFPPFVWMIIAAISLLPLLSSVRKEKYQELFLLFLLFAIPAIFDHLLIQRTVRWSPYQKLELVPEKDGEYTILVNNSAYQGIQNNSLEFRAQHHFQPEVDNFNEYDIPSRLKPDAKNVLVVGAGSGNDLAGVLRNIPDAEVTAVEIDPVIIDFGRKLHPEQPYASSRVHVVNTDARAFFHQSEKKFDLIVFGLLDSHTNGTLTNARLDHLVYTKESIDEAKNLLNPGGVLALIFDPQRRFIIDRLGTTLQQTFHAKPRAFFIPQTEAGWGALIFVSTNIKIGETEKPLPSDLELFAKENDKSHRIEGLTSPTTDDWPYLYLKTPHIPPLFYLLAPILLVLWVLSRRRMDHSTRSLISPVEGFHFLSLGAAFCLLEVYGIAKCSILFGSTWIVSSVVISGVLVMILFANFLTKISMRCPKWIAYFLLIATCGAISLLSVRTIFSLPFSVQAIVAALVYGSPMLFSGVVFARSLSESSSKSAAMSWNLFGALVGGILQITSFTYGIEALLLEVLSLYGAAWILDLILKKAPRASEILAHNG